MNWKALADWDAMMVGLAAEYGIVVKRQRGLMSEPLTFPLRRDKGEICRHGEFLLGCMYQTERPNKTFTNLQVVCPSAQMVLEGDNEAEYVVDIRDKAAVEAFLKYFGVKKKRQLSEKHLKKLNEAGSKAQFR